MITKYCHQEEWIQQNRKNFGNADPLIIEKVIKALTLLDSLSRQDISFIFKGGTSLLLLLPKPLRFSIDIDIIIDKHPDDMSEIFNDIIDDTIFTRWEEDQRETSSHIPKAHYKFYYNSVLSGQDESYILLDILFDDNPYPKLISKDISHPLIDVDGKPGTVHLPDIDGIMGDKLTAFAPRTTGIPKGEGKQLEIIKQLFDIGQLFNEADDLQTIHESFDSFARKEIKYRQQDFLPTDVLTDIFHSSKILSLRGAEDVELFEELQTGINRLSSFIMQRYKIEDAILSSAKAAYLAQLLRSDKNEIERFDESMNLSDVTITGAPLNKLNKVKKIQPEGFFYWYKTSELKGANYRQ
jgi:hypothetical protein